MTSGSLTTRPAWHTKKPSPSSRMPSSNLSRQICIAKTKLNVLFARSRTTSLQYWLASVLHFPCTFWTFFCHRLNSLSAFSGNPRSIQGSAGGNFSKGPLTSTRHQLVRLVVAFLSMQSQLLGGLGISAQSWVSILALP